jgi:hypothetical protein
MRSQAAKLGHRSLGVDRTRSIIIRTIGLGFETSMLDEQCVSNPINHPKHRTYHRSNHVAQEYSNHRTPSRC